MLEGQASSQNCQAPKTHWPLKASVDGHTSAALGVTSPPVTASFHLCPQQDTSLGSGYKRCPFAVQPAETLHNAGVSRVPRKLSYKGESGREREIYIYIHERYENTSCCNLTSLDVVCEASASAVQPPKKNV